MTQLTKVGRVATTVANDGKYTIVTYHQTQVVKWNWNKIILDSGGWETQTTKNRMNQASNQYGLGYQVFQHDFTWYVDYKGQTLEFHDGMVLER
jgi:hypothetical protein